MKASEPLKNISIRKLGGRWKLELLYAIGTQSVRWRTLIHAFPEAAPNVLTRQLRSLELDGLVIRQVLSETPPQIVEYRLSESGKALLPLLEELCQWRNAYDA